MRTIPQQPPAVNKATEEISEYYDQPDPPKQKANGSGADIKSRIDDLIERSKEDQGAAFEDHSLELLRELRASNLAEYERTIGRLKDAKCRISPLEKALGNGSDDGEDDKVPGRQIELKEIEPWPEPVVGHVVLDEIRAHILRHMFIDTHQANATTLFVPHVHMYARFSHTPRLVITAGAAECGKTVLMTHIVGAMVPRPVVVELMKAAPFFRLAELARPTYLIDETDVFIQQDSDLLAAINNGFEPHGCVPRCSGDDHEVRFFSTHTPVVMAGIELGKKLPATTITRSIIVNLERAGEGDILECDYYDVDEHRQGIEQTGRKIARWIEDHADQIADHKPDFPPKVRNRLKQKWKPLLAVADIAGGQWPERARAALLAQPDISEPSRSLQALMDVHTVMRGMPRNIPSEELIRLLCGLEDGSWSSHNFRAREEADRRIQPRQLKALLKPYGLNPDSVRIPGHKTTLKGYKAKELKSAWGRYLPKESPDHVELTDSVFL